MVVAIAVILGLGPLLISSSDWQSFTTKGGIANYFGRNAAAEDYFNRALAVAEDNRQFPNASRVLLSLQNLGMFYEKLGKYDEAAKLDTRVAMIALSYFGEDSEEYHNAISVLHRVSAMSPLLQKCPSFSGTKVFDESKYSKI